jgi:hypothetical protein
MLVSMPLSATFILFDFVVQHPNHPETKQSVSLLGVAAGYFCRLEYASEGFLPGSLLYEFFDVARQYTLHNGDSGEFTGFSANRNLTNSSDTEPTELGNVEPAATSSVSLFKYYATILDPCLTIRSLTAFLEIARRTCLVSKVNFVQLITCSSLYSLDSLLRTACWIFLLHRPIPLGKLL